MLRTACQEFLAFHQRHVFVGCGVKRPRTVAGKYPIEESGILDVADDTGNRKPWKAMLEFLLDLVEREFRNVDQYRSTRLNCATGATARNRSTRRHR